MIIGAVPAGPKRVPRMPPQPHEKPPKSLDELKGLLSRLDRDQTDIRLGRRARQALSELVDAPDRTAVYSISELARRTGVNPSTLSRLAVNLGYSGFSAFQDIFRDYIANKGNFYSGRADRLIHTKGDKGGDLSVLAQIGEEEIANVLGVVEHIAPGELEAAADLLIAAPRIRTYGLRQPSAIASFACYGLGLLRGHVSILGLQQHGVAFELAQLSKDDVLLVFGFAPYTRATVATARVAASMGIKIIAVTDSHASPFLPVADHQFIAPTTGSFFSNSMAASIVVVEGLLAVMAQRLGKPSLVSLEKHERLINEFDIEL